MKQRTMAMLNDLAAQQVKLIEFFQNENVSRQIDALSESYTKNKVLLTGVGKCSFLAMKQAATLKSIGIDAEYIDCINALHGDLGGIPKNYSVTLVCLSKSGMSSELLNFLKIVTSHCPNVNATLMTMSNPDNEASQTTMSTYRLMDVTILQLPTDDVAELDGFGIVPSISNALFEIALSVITSNIPWNTGDVLIRLKDAHPGGSLQGKVTKILAGLPDDAMSN
jgi:D-arabinose 5-phosphate isomerase GutQ